MGDATRLTQAVVNLLSNACKFTPPGGDIGISLRVEPDGPALLAVRDNGIGCLRALSTPSSTCMPRSIPIPRTRVRAWGSDCIW